MSLVFNHEIQVDLFWIESKPVLHIIDRGIRYSIAKFIENHSAEHLWNSIVENWVCIFGGFPNILAHDQGSQLTSDFFFKTCAEFGISMKATPTESHNSLSIFERYHPLIRRVYRKVRMEYPAVDCHLVLTIAVHAVNTTAGPDGITPSLLLFGTSPKLPIATLSLLKPNQRDRFRAIESAKKEMLSITAERRLKAAFSLRSPSTTFSGKEGDQVLVYREASKSWEGPFPVHSYNGLKTVHIEVPEGSTKRITPFSTGSVKLFNAPAPVSSTEDTDVIDAATAHPVSAYPVTVHDAHDFSL